MSRAVLLVSILIALQCQLQRTGRPVQFHTGKIYHTGEKPAADDAEKIRKILATVGDAVIAGDISVLPDFVDKNRGIYLDLKGLWTYRDLLLEMQKENSYLDVFFIRGKKGVVPVREILQKSGGVVMDLYFESAETCEVKFRFKKNKNLANDLNNPYLIKTGNSWKIYRLF